MVTSLFIYKFVFVVELAVAEVLFTFRLKKRSRFVLRALGSAAVLLALTALFPSSISAEWYTSLMFFVIFAASIPLLKFCYAEPWRNLLFCGIASYTMQHFAYELAALAASLIVWGRSPLFGVYNTDPVLFHGFGREFFFVVLVYLLCYMGSYWAMFAVFASRIRKNADMKIKSVSLLFLIGVGLLTDIVLNSVVIYRNNDLVGSVTICIYNLLCCVLLLFGQFSLLQSKELQDKLDAVNRLWREEKKQFASLKENMDLINMKCHDIRHQIRTIGADNSVSAEAIAQIEDSIRVYDATVKTGNEALDVILTEKSLRCTANGIFLSYMVDGTALNFINGIDLFSLFGNALDNAIEAVMRIEDDKARIIGIKVHTSGEFVAINVSNTYTGEIVYGTNGLPLTSKEDTNYHGFGMKSIAYVVEKYGGECSVLTKNGVFHLNILFPLKRG